MEPTTQVVPVAEAKRTSKRKKLALFLLIAPAVITVIAFLLFIVVNIVFNPSMQLPADGEPYAATPIGFTIANIVLISIGIVSLASYVPALIIGIYLLRTKK